MFAIKLKSDVFGEDNNTNSLPPLDAQRERRVIRDAVVEQVNRINSSLNNLENKINEYTSSVDDALTKVTDALRKDFVDLEEIIANAITEQDVYNFIKQEIQKLVEDSTTADADIMVTINGLRKAVTTLRKDAANASVTSSESKNDISNLREEVEMLSSQIEGILIRINRPGTVKSVLNSIAGFFKWIWKGIAKAFSKVF